VGALRIALRALQLVETGECGARGDTREPFADHRGVDKHSIVADHVGEPAVVGVARGAVLFEADPPVQNERGQAVARFTGKGCRGVEAAAHLRRVDSEQAHAAQPRDGDGVAVEDCRHENRIGAREAGRR
jgi:hypothetical protein